MEYESLLKHTESSRYVDELRKGNNFSSHARYFHFMGLGDFILYKNMERNFEVRICGFTGHGACILASSFKMHSSAFYKNFYESLKVYVKGENNMIETE